MSKDNVKAVDFEEVYDVEVNYIMKRRKELKEGTEFHGKLKERENLKKKQENLKMERKNLKNEQKNLKKEELDKKEKELDKKQEELDKKMEVLKGLEPNVDYNLVGLCFSGGGIRSATFNLGLVQAMAKKGVFKLCDYLSTISGGSYIGSCLSNLLSQQGSKTYGDKFPFFFKGGKSEKGEVKHLRNHSNFLTPNVGLFSRDTWYMIAIILRGMFLNFIILFSFFAAILSGFMLGQYYLYWKGNAPWAGLDKWNTLEGWCPPAGHYFPITLTMGFFIATIVLFPIIIWLPQIIKKSIFTHNFRKRYGNIQLVSLSVALLVLLIILLPFGVQYLPGYVNNIVGGISLASLFAIFKSNSGTAGKYQRIIKRLLPVVIPFFFVGLSIYIMGEWLVPKKNEWDLRMMSAIDETQRQELISKFKADKKTCVVLIVDVTINGTTEWTIAGFNDEGEFKNVLIDDASSELAIELNKEESNRNKIIKLATSYLPPTQMNCKEWENMLVWSKKMWWIFGWSFGIFVLYGYFININRSSIHNFYKDKITDTYIFKSNKKGKSTNKTENSTEFVGDHMKLLKDLHEGGNGAPYHLINATLNLTGEDKLSLRGRKADFFLFSKEYCGSEMTGYKNTEKYYDNYFNMWESNSSKSVTLGRATTISGAAISPQSGHSTIPSISFLMTLMNTRVGFWMPNPKENEWHFIFWPWYLVYRELFSRTRHDSYLCNLADGNFIENLGIYQLLKRKCKYIIAVDVGADPDMKFKDLGNVLRKVRIDLGVQINLDVEMLRKEAETNLSKWHCVASTIHYSKKEKGILLYIKSSLTGDEPEDLFHYQKQNPTFPHETTADQFFDEAQFESYRQLGYHVGQKVFEEFNIVENELVTNDMLSENFGKLLSKWRPPVPDLSKSFLRNAEKYMELEKLLKESPALAQYDLQNYPELEGLVDAVEKLEEAKKDTLQAEDKVERLADEQESVGIKHKGEGLDKNVAEGYKHGLRQSIHLCNMQITLMENVWMALDLDRYYNYPDNRGWMNLFRRWARSEIFRMVWSINKGLYGRNFKEFAETHLNLPKSSEYKFNREEEPLGDNVTNEFTDILKRNQKEKDEKWKEKYGKWIEILKDPKKENGEIWTIKNDKVGGKGNPFVMGIALLTKKEEGTVMLEFIVVRDFLQRMGLGKLLFDEILKDLKERKIDTLCTEIRKDTPKPIKDFYYRLGFREEKEEEEGKKEQEDKLILEL